MPPDEAIILRRLRGCAPTLLLVIFYGCRGVWGWVGAGPMIVQVKESRQGARTPYTWVAILQVRGRIESCVSERPRLHMFWFELVIPAS